EEMEVMTEEKKKIFRARKTMKISDRLQLESLHSTLLNSAPGLSNPSPPPLVNGTHKEDGQKVGDKEQSSSSDPNSPQAASPATPGSLSSPAPFLSLNLSPSPGSSQSPNPQEEDILIQDKTAAPEEVAKHEKPPSPGEAPSDSSTHPPASGEDKRPTAESKEEDSDKASVEKDSNAEEKMEVNSVKVEFKKEKGDAGQEEGPTRHKGQKSSNSGLKRTLSEGNENDAVTVKREGKRPKVEHEELEAQLELKITAKGGNQQKLEKIVQQLVNERLKILELTIFDKHFQELKDRVDKIDCATKHQTAINSLQSKIARLAKKFGEANQVSENKRKQEDSPKSTRKKTATSRLLEHSPQNRPVRTSVEVKQTTAAVGSSSTAAPPASASASALAPASTSTTTLVPSILQLITSSSNAASTFSTGITTQSQPGTLVLKTTPGSSMVTAGQPLVIQLPLSVNGQTGTLVNFPVSSLAAATSLNKAKTTPSTTTFILKPSPAANTASAPVATTQISLARAVYQGGAGRITTPNAGVSVTTVRAPAQSVSVAGAVSSASSPATSGPAATGSTAPGTPQGMSLTSKTDNQASVPTPSKAAAPPPPARPKGSVIDLTEDDDDVQVTGVKTAQGATPSSGPRPNPVISIPNTNLTTSKESLKSRTVTTTTTRGPSSALPPLPPAPAPQRLPPEAEQTSPPQQLQLKLVPGQTGIVLSWSVAETDRTCATVDSYHLYAFHQDNSSSGTAQQHWKKIGEVNALPLPMACTLTQFQSGSTYYFAVRAKDIYGRYGSFCEPQCTNVISSSSSLST
uniref:Activating transcription factor 7 interacting protein n=1 Tax=Poecilia formosa TaxID=48698 RepID=A0A096LW75_POEFO